MDYRYDALGRRVRKGVSGGTAFDTQGGWPTASAVGEPKTGPSDAPSASEAGSAPRTTDADGPASPAVSTSVSDTSAAPTPRDNIYSTIKERTLAAAAPDKAAVRTLDTGAGPIPGPAVPGAPVLLRSFVYGTEYIDEVVAHIMPDGKVRWVMQDANFNVVAIVRACDNKLVRQFRYGPYGDFERQNLDGDITGIEGFDSAGQPVPLTPADSASPQAFEGLWYDAETGLYWMRGRPYDPITGRFLSNDPNEQALIVANLLAMNAQTPAAFASLSASGQYGDGMNLYLGFGGNPVNLTDPSGMVALDFDDDFETGFDDPGEEQFFGNLSFDRTMDWMAETEDLSNEVTGTKLYALGTINEGARWASLGLETTLNIASGLLGIDVLQSVEVVADGRGGFWDAMNIVMSVAPGGSLGKAVGKLSKAFKHARRAGKATKLAASAAKHLFKILPYNQAKKLTKGHKHTIEAHHILEGRHARAWGLDEGSIPAVILSQAEHTRINQMLRSKLPYGVDYSKQRQRVWATYKDVYTRLGYGEWLQHIDKYFR